ncbi:MAG TPA: peptidylprolyl isomerase [Gammaproteobacteria bacterium]|nr:peptidylprolyl isomerase [Gammaproteobacteria bacterium]
MSNMIIEDGKFIELTYKVVDKKTSEILSAVEFPLGYIQGISEILSPEVTAGLVGQVQGDIVEIPVDIDLIYGPRDESLVTTMPLDGLDDDLRKIGTMIPMENDKGERINFTVISINENSVTLDGNNPLCGRDVIFVLKVVTVREPTNEEARLGGPIDDVLPEFKNAKSIH